MSEFALLKNGEIPAGWTSIAIGEFRQQRSQTFNPASEPEGKFELYSVPSHAIGRPEIVRTGDIGSNKQYVGPGDVLISKINPRLNRTWVVKERKKLEQIASTEWVVFPKNPALDSRFLAEILSDARLRDFLASKGSGVGGSLTRIRPDLFDHVDLPIPPINEQRRIVAKIEELFSELDKGVESLRLAREQLKLYRQSVLKHAFEGKLTADWREANPDSFDSGETLRTIVAERRRAEWEKATLDELIAKGRKPKNDKWKARYKLPQDIEPGELPSLPEQWCWISLDELVAGRPRSMQSGPFGSNLKHSEFQAEGVLVVGIDNVRDGWFSGGSDNRISVEKFEELAKYQARPGDLLVTVMASLGRTCVIPDDIETAIITKHVYRITMERDLVDPAFYNLLLQTEWVSRRRMFNNAMGQTRPGLNSGILKALPVPLCSIEEQQLIVERLSVEIDRIERLEAEVETQLAKTIALRQSILKQAFSGQLVPQDPSDEPAAALLERIKADKATKPKTTRRRMARAS